jgi:photoactive yellow protein
VGGLLAELVAMSSKELDTLPFGVIQFSEHYIVERYNYCEAVNTGLSAEKVVGLHVFTQLAQCMNNFMVAQRFEDAILNNMALDETLDYVLTWRMRPTPILLRLLWNPQASQSGFLVLHRLS